MENSLLVIFDKIAYVLLAVLLSVCIATQFNTFLVNSHFWKTSSLKSTSKMKTMIQ